MISESKKLIFIHNPKAAGCSIKSMLWKRADDWKFNKWHYDIHYISYYINGLWDDYTSFGICRNPYDRFVSAFLYNIEKVSDINNYQKGRRARMLHWESYPKTYPILAKWVDNDLNIIDNFRRFVLGPDFDCIFGKEWPIHFRSQYRFLKGMSPEMQLDHTIRFEDISSFNTKEIIGENIEFPKLNSTKSHDYRDFYTAPVQDRVLKKYWLDFHAFEYDTELGGF